MLASDVAEIIECISNTYQVYGEPSNGFLAAEAAKEYSKAKLSLYYAVSRILFDLDLELPESERQGLYIAEDCFSWHDSVESQAILHVEPLFDKYRPIYERAVSKFSI